MGLEVISREEISCMCDEGTIEIVILIGDWPGQSEKRRQLKCSKCHEQDKKRKEAQRVAKELTAKAKAIAIDKYSRLWIERFNGHNLKQIREPIKNNYGYPALGTFYKHVKEDGGRDEYLQKAFADKPFERTKELGIKDHQVEELLKEARSLLALGTPFKRILRHNDRF